MRAVTIDGDGRTDYRLGPGDCIEFGDTVIELCEGSAPGRPEILVTSKAVESAYRGRLARDLDRG